LQRTTASSQLWPRQAPAWLLPQAMTSMSSCGDELAFSRCAPWPGVNYGWTPNPFAFGTISCSAVHAAGVLQ